jgi:KUP system potassium uptake protein
MFGSGLLLGDGVITPAISVLSAVEGLQIASNSFEPAIMPITVILLILLFAVQRFGTEKVGTSFGPVMVMWFASLACIGIYQISFHPSIFRALNPYYAINFFKMHGLFGWECLGAVVLCITGCEAMYADMGHFGKNSVRAAWLVAVYPSLVMNYLGQGALLLGNPDKIDDPFFHSIPDPVFWPMFALSILATIIASQALISGAFSLTQQAVSLASFPRLKIVHTSKSVAGQIYIPAINVMLMVCCVLLVIGFRTSEGLANAYGVAVCGDMMLTSTMFLSLAFLRWRWNPIIIAWLAIQFGLVDLAFLTSNLRKVPSGGWFPLLFAVILVTLMYVWRSGQLALKEKIKDEQLPVETLLEQLKESKISQCEGTGVFMSGAGDGIPHVCTQFLKHVPVMHRTAIFLTIKYRHEPFVGRSESKLIQLGDGIYRIVLECGYMETTLNIDHLQEVAQINNTQIEFKDATYYLGNELVVPKKGTWIGHRIFIDLFNLLLQFSHKSTASSFKIPDRNLIYVGNNYVL